MQCFVNGNNLFREGEEIGTESLDLSFFTIYTFMTYFKDVIYNISTQGFMLKSS